jgi:hypothetical protein
MALAIPGDHGWKSIKLRKGGDIRKVSYSMHSMGYATKRESNAGSGKARYLSDGHDQY